MTSSCYGALEIVGIIIINDDVSVTSWKIRFHKMIWYSYWDSIKVSDIFWKYFPTEIVHSADWITCW